MTRRTLLLSLAASAAAQSKPAIPFRALNHVTMTVKDVQRSVDFYQSLFGLPVQARQGPTVLLRIGQGPQFLALNPAPNNARTGIHHFCVTTDTFSLDTMFTILASHGIDRAKVRVRMRPAELGGAKDGTPELYFIDPDGLTVQIQHSSYCGGAGALGEACTDPIEPPKHRGFLALRDLHHVLLHVPNAERARAFYRELFSNQRATIAIAQAPQTAIAHASFSMDSFRPKQILAAMSALGIHDVQAEKDSVTFSDLDGIRIQLC
ncbi:MAG: VOC family protein [Acidobacteria bacterium]|nr:VOC family protein [Acidobacteriota bacterium]